MIFFLFFLFFHFVYVGLSNYMGVYNYFLFLITVSQFYTIVVFALSIDEGIQPNLHK